ncbi:DUF4335 domain-containing protein [Pantanalinema rosaneae CENA516]|uniref:DUF4335 domain-containing protein n=1 Tax=Pantanalinema rosaneae TaxID=1620701 RepID=UPI003D6F646F
MTLQSYSVLRRYTPPTCTLELMGKQSPLSRWAGQPVLKQLRFQLKFDDPKLLADEQVTLQGDRDQLEALHEAVTDYVQRFLEHSSDRLELPLTISSTPQNTVTLADFATGTYRATPAHNVAGIELQPRGLLSHELILGSLANSTSGQTLHLTTLQLFDLANALDDYATDVMALPQLQQAGGRRSHPHWSQIAAAALLVIGVSASVAKLIDGSYSTISQTTAPLSSQGASSQDQKIATQLPPSVVEKTVPPIASTAKLPPPTIAPTTVPITPGQPTINTPVQIPEGQGVPVSPIQPGQPGTIAINPNDAEPSDNIATVPGTVVPPAPAIVAPPRTAGGSARQLPTELADANRQASEAPAPNIAALRGAASSAAGAAPATTESANNTAFDTLPQVAEARTYFQERWSPPEGLNQMLEYSLAIAPNGSIQGISPLGTAAGNYLDRVGIPLVGEPFVSPLPEGRSVKIRLVLSPDGTVQTFPESSN